MIDHGLTSTEHVTRASQALRGRLRDAVCRMLTFYMSHSILKPDYFYERLSSRIKV
ncbi:hypothetical protein J6590_047230 [Homalodisca vitripennis]|nr:hypothetical protein J6590_047230 [Homalodisca vitripennis]